MTAHRDRTRSTRLVARQISELLTAHMWLWHELVPQERITGIVFGVVLSGSIAHHGFRDAASGQWIGVEDARALGRPVTASAIAQSMHLPHTTVRRYATQLVDAGLLVRETAGFSVAPRIFADDALARVAAADAAEVLRALSALAEAGYAPAARAIAAGVAEVPPGVVQRLLLAFILRVLEDFTELYGDVTAGGIMAAIIAANIRHITEDPELARLYADEDMPPPDTLRRPIALRPLSRAMQLPFETLRRRVAALVAEGLIVWKEGGVIVPTHVLLDHRYLEHNRRCELHFKQMVDLLVGLAGDQRDAFAAAARVTR